MDQWDRINYPSLTREENEEIRKARRQGFAGMYPAFPDGDSQDRNTLKGAREHLSRLEHAGN